MLDLSKPFGQHGYCFYFPPDSRIESAWLPGSFQNDLLAQGRALRTDTSLCPSLVHPLLFTSATSKWK